MLSSHGDNTGQVEAGEIESVDFNELSGEATLGDIEQKIRDAIDKERLRTWLQPQPSRVYRDLAGRWMAIGLAISAVAYWQNWIVYLLAFFVIGFSQYGLFILGHDAIHYTLHPNRKVNDLLARWLIYGSLFMGLDDGRRNHLNHHRWVGTTNDPDRYLHSLADKNSRLKLFFFCTGLATFGKTVLKVSPFGKLQQRKTTTEKLDPGNLKGYILSQPLMEYLSQRLSVFVMQMLLIVSFLAMGLPWWSYLVLWIAPIYFCVFLPDEVRAFCDHAVDLVPDTAADPYRLVSFTPSWLEAMVFSPHNINYHAEHHLFPAVPYYNLPRVHQDLRYNSQITVKQSYLGYLIQLFAKLPLTIVGSSDS
ncbi:fatty acid desaturase family protein [Leptodesmis sp.]|uniref:fatty acid desaturase family protein n=1 Tax=Leptodesmis sp. TaxID=3100501 RepID=UPI00405354BB